MTTDRTIDVSGLKQGLKASCRKENAGLYRSYKILDLSKRMPEYHAAACPVDIRVYWPNEVCYACVWISTDEAWGNGSGKAGGYGYDKETDAIENAFLAAGVKFTKPFGASGREPLREFLADLARTLGMTDFVIVESHG